MSDSEDRFVSPQPLAFGETFNLRKMTQLPLYLLLLYDTEQMKTLVACNVEFLVAKLKAMSVK